MIVQIQHRNKLLTSSQQFHLSWEQDFSAPKLRRHHSRRQSLSAQATKLEQKKKILLFGWYSPSPLKLGSTQIDVQTQLNWKIRIHHAISQLKLVSNTSIWAANFGGLNSAQKNFTVAVFWWDKMPRRCFRRWYRRSQKFWWGGQNGKFL